MRYIALLLAATLQLLASMVHVPLKSVDEAGSSATIEIEHADVGMSGFIVHKITDGREIILKNVVVTSFDADTKTATLSMSDFDALKNNALPSSEWNVEIGDKVVLAFSYTRALLIAPNEEIYHRVSSSFDVQWVHPDIFAAILSLNSHPTPTMGDFLEMSSTASVGLIYFYIEGVLYTVDAKSFKVLSVLSAPLEQKSTKLPFYTRVDEIESNWWNFGEGTSELSDYESYYMSLILKHNPQLNR